jgi:hypothetical protein
VTRLCLVLAILLSATVSFGKSAQRENPEFELSQIGFVLDGRQFCEDSERLQDFPSKMMDKIIEAGPKGIPTLIGMLTDIRPVRTREPLICFWPQMTVSDVAFCLLSDLFSGPKGTTLPGADWDDLIGHDEADPAWVRLNKYIEKHGRKSLQRKWQALWMKYKDRIVWNSSERCFTLRAA